MSASAITPLGALRRLIAAVKLIDFADCKDERVWNQLGGELGVAEGVVRDYVEQKPVGHVNHYSSGSVGVSGQSMLTLPHGAPLYAAPVAAQPSRTALGDEIIAALDALQTGCTEPSWIGWENGEGEEVGTRLQAAIDAYKAAPTVAVSAAPSGEAAIEKAILRLREAHDEYLVRSHLTRVPQELSAAKLALYAAITATKE